MPQDQKRNAPHGRDELAKLREENILLRETILLRERIARLEAGKMDRKWGVVLGIAVLIAAIVFIIRLVEFISG